MCGCCHSASDEETTHRDISSVVETLKDSDFDIIEERLRSNSLTESKPHPVNDKLHDILNKNIK